MAPTIISSNGNTVEQFPNDWQKNQYQGNYSDKSKQDQTAGWNNQNSQQWPVTCSWRRKNLDYRVQCLLLLIGWKNWCSNIWYNNCTITFDSNLFENCSNSIRLITYLRKRRWTLFKYSAQNWDEEGSSFSRSYHKSKIFSLNMKTMSIRAHSRPT